MSVVSVERVMRVPPGAGPFMVDDLEATPDDGRRYELLDGAYVEVSRVVSDETFRATGPFPVEIVPARLAAGLREG